MRPYAAIALAVASLSTPSRADTKLSLDDAVRIAIENNPDFVILREDTAIAEAQIGVAQGAFAPHLIGELRFAYDHSPGSAFRIESTDQQFTGSLALAGRLPIGTDYRLEVSAIRDSLDSGFTIYRPAQSYSIRLNLTQPLLRNAWLTPNRGTIVVATLRRDASRNLRQAELERVVSAVEIAYWGLVVSQQERDVRTGALTLAKEQLEGSKTQFRHGAVAETDVAEAESAVAHRVDDIEFNNQDLAEIEGRLLALLQPGLGKLATDGSSLIATELPQSLPVPGSLEDHLAIARAHRPDLLAARANLQAEEVALAVARNHLLPQLDVVGSAGVTGFSGTLDNGYGTLGFGGNTFGTSPVDGHMLPPFWPDRSLEGGVGTMFANTRFFSASVGLKLDVALDNRLARSQADAQAHQVQRQRASVELLERQVTYQVVTAYKRVLADLARIKATTESMRLSEKLLEGQRKRFRAGVAVSFDVLRTADELTRSRISNLRALVNGRISQARLAVAQGTYLDDHHIAVK